LIEKWLIFIIVFKEQISKVIVERNQILVVDDEEMSMRIKHSFNFGEVFYFCLVLVCEGFEELQETSELLLDILVDHTVDLT
jgi:hypothetical protein